MYKTPWFFDMTAIASAIEPKKGDKLNFIKEVKKLKS